MNRGRAIEPSPRRARIVAVAASALLIGGGLAACSDDSSSGAAGAGSQECITAADEFLQPWNELPTSLPASPPGGYVPLSKPAQPGGSIVFLASPIPSVQDGAKGMAVAAESIGWSSKTLNFDGNLPDMLVKFDQAIAEKPTAIWVQAFPAAGMQKQLDAAKNAGIVVGMTSVADEPTSVPGFAAVSNGPVTAEEIGELQANLVMRDSKCTANVAMFTLPFPIIEATDNAFTSTLKEKCPDCKVSTTLVQPQDLGTPKTASAIVSKLQSDPTVKYAYTVIGNVANGVAPALRQAGLKDIKIFGNTPDADSIASLRDGTNAWWVNQNPTLQAWGLIDSVLRAIDSGAPHPDGGHYPLAVLTPENVPDGTGVPALPTDYQAEFEALWGVS